MSSQLCLALAALSILSPVLAPAQAPPSVWDGIYSDTQATKGAGLYSGYCASCHGMKLEGRGPTPPLAGDSFLMNWSGTTMGDLFDKIQTSMPADRPGQLSREDNAAIVAYILKTNKFPAGAKDLAPDPDVLSKIHIDAAKPK